MYRYMYLVHLLQIFQLKNKKTKPTIYSEGAINSIVAFWTSGLLCGSPYDLLTGLYINSSGTTQIIQKQFQINLFPPYKYILNH